MPSKDRRINALHDSKQSGAVDLGTGPREKEKGPKSWDPSKPPGGKLPKPAPKAEKKS